MLACFASSTGREKGVWSSTSSS